MIEPVFFDVETYANDKYSLRRLSEVQYILDPRFELLSVAAAADGRVKVWRGDSDEWLPQFRAWDAEGRRFIAHNARFDLRVLRLQYEFQPGLLGDTCSLARYFWYGDHGLDALGRELLNAGKQGSVPWGKRLGSMTLQEWGALAHYNAVDVALCRCVWLNLEPRLPRQELELIQQTLAIQLRPQRINQIAAAKLEEECKARQVEIVAKRPGIMELASRPIQLRAHLHDQYQVAVDTVDKKKLGNLGHFDPEAADFLRDVWRYKELGKAAKDARSLESRMGLGDGTVLVDLNYCGAHSHRWTSGGGSAAPSSFNYQNLSKSAGIRELNVPRPGNVFIIGDLAQIEARITAYLAGEEPQLAAFLEGRDLYLEFAQPLFGRPLTKGDLLERSVGKVAVLGLGFGMGARLFAERLSQSAPQGLALLQREFNVEDPEEAARRVVDRYRSKYPRIHQNAKSMFEWFKYVVAERPEGPVQVGAFIKIAVEDGNVTVTLPTGGVLTYRDVGLTTYSNSFGTRLIPTYLDRKVTFSMPIENAVQAVARDVFARALLDLERAGFEIAFHVHDEVVVEVDAAQARERLTDFKAILGANDGRCPGLPIACEAFLADRYTKDENYMREFTEKFVAAA